tara:strand:+ start:35 stop:418 length:384 start_codon:yes stop_codon:yes gene_type:complete
MVVNVTAHALNKIEPHQIQIKVLEDIRVLEDFIEPPKPRLIFDNYRPNGTGLRLTPYGNKVCKRLYDSSTIKIKEEVKGKNLIMLDKHLFWPYYLTKREITMFGATDVFDLKLYDGDINAWCKAKSS